MKSTAFVFHFDCHPNCTGDCDLLSPAANLKLFHRLLLPLLGTTAAAAVFVSIPVAWEDSTTHEPHSFPIITVERTAENVQFMCREINKSDHGRNQKISVYPTDPP